MFSTHFPRLTILTAALMAGGGPFSAPAQELHHVRINEVMSSNGSTLADLASEFGDWIEIYNAGTAPIDLTGWGLSDDPSRPFRWVFPRAKVPAGGYLLVWATGTQGEKVLAPETLVSARSIWNYHDLGVDFGDAFYEPEFDDSAWARGPAPLGYGPLANYVTTTLSFGRSSQNKHMTTWFRHAFEVEDSARVDSLNLGLWIDDGAIVYLNGSEIARENLPPGPVTYDTRTITYVGPWPSWTSYPVELAGLRTGQNTLAVRLHQHAPTSSDLAFDLELSGMVERRELRAGFSLSKSGEPLLLTQPDGTVVDHLDIPALPRDVSFGRVDTDPQRWAYFAEATPGEANTTEAFDGVLVPPTFTTEPGFYSTSVEVGAEHQDEQVVVRYTINGRPPESSDPLWAGPLQLQPLPSSWSAGALALIRTTPGEGDSRGYGWLPPIGEHPKGHIIRMRAERAGYLPSEVVGGTWWVGPDFDDRHRLPVVSLQIDAADFFDYVRGIYVPGKIYDDNGFGADFFGRPNANYHQAGLEWERPVQFEFFENGTRQVAGGLFARLHGAGSRAVPQKSIRLYDRDGGALAHPFFAQGGRRTDIAFDRLLLRNSGQDWYAFGPTMLRDGYLQRLVAHLDFETQEYRPTVAYLNGEYWGIHNLRERIDTRYLERLFGVDREQVDLLANNAEPKAGSSADYLELRDFVHNQSMAVPENYQAAAARIDISSFIDYHIANIFLVNTDWPGNNIEYWRTRREPDPTAPKGHDGRWRWIMFDLDFCAQPEDVNVDMISRLKTPLSGWPRPEWSLRMIRGLWESPEFAAEFCTRFADHLNTTFQPARAHQLADSMAEAIEHEIVAHNRRWGRATTLATWRSNVERLRTFASRRPDQVWNHLANHFPTRGTSSVSVRQLGGGHVRINSIHLDGAFTPGIEGRPAQWQGRWFRAYPIEVEAIPDAGMVFSHWQETGSTSALLSFAPQSAVMLTPVFEPAPPSVLVYYWAFNDAAQPLAPTHTLGDGSLAVLPGPATTVTTGGGQEFKGENNQRIEPTGTHLRVNDPIDATLVFALPTTGYSPHTLAYEARRSGSGAALHQVFHSPDGGLHWHPLASIIPPDGKPELFHIALDGLPEAIDNPHFAIQITISQGIGGDIGNNRFDNVTLHAWPLDGTIAPPEPIAQPVSATWTVGSTESFDPSPYFLSTGGRSLAYQLEGPHPLGVSATADHGSLLVATPNFHGGGMARLTATVADHPEAGAASVDFYLLVYPEPLALADGRFIFSEWVPEAPAGTMPPDLLFLQSTRNDPPLDAPLPHAYHVPADDMAPADLDAGRLALPYQLTARTRLNALGADGVSFINTGRGRDLGAALTTLDTRSLPAAEVAWTAETLAPGSRRYGIRLQYRTDGNAPWKDVPDADGAPIEYTGSNNVGDERRIGPHPLPADALGRPWVQLRWTYHHIAGTNGPRDELRLDDLLVRLPPESATSYPQWAAAHFAAADPQRSPDEAPAGDGVANLFRYAHSLAPTDPVAPVMPRLAAQATAFRFRLDPSKSDLAWIVQASPDLSDWSEVWFDSRVHPTPNADADGWRSIPSPHPSAKRFFLRLEIRAIEPQ